MLKTLHFVAPPANVDNRGYYKMTKSLALRLTLLCFSAVLTVTPANAQVETGLIDGTVTDASGAVVPNANVAIKSAATGLTVTVRTNEAGRFLSPPLKPGDYEVSVSLSGFKSSVLRVR